MNLKGEIVVMCLKREWKNFVLFQLYFCIDIEKLNFEKLESFCYLEFINFIRLKVFIFVLESDFL